MRQVFLLGRKLDVVKATRRDDLKRLCLLRDRLCLMLANQATCGDLPGRCGRIASCGRLHPVDGSEQATRGGLPAVDALPVVDVRLLPAQQVVRGDPPAADAPPAVDIL